MIRRTIAIALLFISISTIILVPIFTFTPIGKRLFDGSTSTPTPTLKPFTPTPTPKPIPILTAKGTPPAITARESILLDGDTGHILYESNGEKPVPMASTTKIMTALIAIQAGDLNTVVTIHQDAAKEVIQNNGSNAKLHIDDQPTLRSDCAYSTLLTPGYLVTP